jgi:serine/threonine-protein kinase
MRQGRLPPRELAEIMVPVLQGVAAAHRAGVIHRDLKPDNVFLCVGPDGSARGPKVLDFGISKLCNTPAPEEALTSEGTGLGTLAYMSSEQLIGAPNVDERTDIYAAGVMMYEALAGRLPFRADSHNALVLAIASQLPLPISMIVHDVHPALESIVMRAMAKDASSRQPNVLLLIHELEAWLAASAPPKLPTAASAGASSAEAPAASGRRSALRPGARGRASTRWLLAACISLSCLLALQLWGRTATSEQAQGPGASRPSVHLSTRAVVSASTAGARAVPVAIASTATTGEMPEVSVQAKPALLPPRSQANIVRDARLRARSRAGAIRLSDL